MDDCGGDLHAGIDGFSNGAADGVPALIVVPGDKLLPAVFNKVHVGEGRGVEREGCDSGHNDWKEAQRTWWRGSGTKDRIRG